MAITFLTKIRTLRFRLFKFKDFLIFIIINRKLNIKIIARKFSLFFKTIDIGDKIIPWIPFKAKIWLDKTLKSDMILFEFGSGLSTIYFSKRVKKIISIEHNKNWYNRFKNKIIEEQIDNCEYYLKEPESMTIVNTEYTSDLKEYHGYNFKNYVESIDQYPNKHFDIVFIDGRVRINCILHSINKIKKGGFLILDNSDEEKYKNAQEILKNYKKLVFFDVAPLNPYYRYSKTCFWETIVWQIK